MRHLKSIYIIQKYNWTGIFNFPHKFLKIFTPSVRSILSQTIACISCNSENLGSIKNSNLKWKYIFVVVECVYPVCRNDTSDLQRLLLATHTHTRRTLPSKLATPVGDQAGRQASLSSGWLTQANGTWWKHKQNKLRKKKKNKLKKQRPKTLGLRLSIEDWDRDPGLRLRLKRLPPKSLLSAHASDPSPYSAPSLSLSLALADLLAVVAVSRKT